MTVGEVALRQVFRAELEAAAGSVFHNRDYAVVVRARLVDCDGVPVGDWEEIHTDSITLPDDSTNFPGSM